MSNTMTYDDLLKLPVTKLREIALTLEAIQGVHGMNKEQVMQAICTAKGIENPYKKEAEKRKAEARASIIEMKVQRQNLRAELAQQKAALSKDEKKGFREKIKKASQGNPAPRRRLIRRQRSRFHFHNGYISIDESRWYCLCHRIQHGFMAECEWRRSRSETFDSHLHKNTCSGYSFARPQP